ncbi:hypothetical protein [Streptomyces antimicrobicus]|uniref:Uncharacterized protein n=1 Tax=Streptomyces antimicrobicus TaxID=2883108 RepID=A0ABS8BFQ9_9ACTN|nr:hypothetical protein [Streptomyces antimicrobicus]MCB5183472.1 hypothetical protein [Streptomyces antimicrobicus]
MTGHPTTTSPHPEPCADCVQEEWQTAEPGPAGGLRWYAQHHCPRHDVLSCDRGRGVPPRWVRDRIAASEGTVRLTVGGRDGIPVALLRRVYALGLAELTTARAEGWWATPVEARFLVERAGVEGARRAARGRGGRSPGSG